MPARLREHSLAGVEQNDRQIRGRSAGDHVARVLLVTRRISDDEVAAVGREVAVGHVDRDPLLPLGGETVDEQRKVDVLPLRAHLPRVRLEGRELILEDHLRIEQEPADERRLAVIDAAAGNEAQETLVLVLREISLDVPRNELVRPVAVVANEAHQK